jgi:amino acid adenylation domain-containing protein
MDIWEQTLAWGLIPEADRKEAPAPAPGRKRSDALPVVTRALLPTAAMPFDVAAACVFAVLSKCEGDDAVVVVDSSQGPPVAVVNPFATLAEAPFTEAIARVAEARKAETSSAVRGKLADSVAQRAKSTSAGAASNAMVGTTAVLTKATFEAIGDVAAVHAFDVLFVVHATEGSMKVSFVYNKSLFSDATATDRLELFEMIYRAVVSGGPDTTLRSIANVTPRMLDRLLSDWQQERVPFREYSRTLPDVFIETAQTRCNAHQQTAVLEPSTGRTITYHDMLVRARKLARYLHAKHPQVPWGVDATCGIHVPRCLDWYVMMLGIHLAGGAYLSLDPDFPGDRLLYCLEDSGAVCLFTIRRMVGSLGFKGPTHVIDELWDEIDAMDDTEEFVSPTTPLSPAYLIYTSGSTGKPKGVCIEHRNAVNFVESERRLYGLDNTHRVLQGFSTSFDASVEELWMAFANGGMLIVVEKSTMQDVELLGKLVESTKATVFSTVPTLLATIDARYLRTLELVIAGGEACNKEVVAAYATGGKRRFVNSYGPTEATVACMADYSTPDRPVTIGRPQPGYFACIVNSRMELVPPGVPGELCMAGPSVARGYVNRPELTAEKFAHCPYVSRWREGFPEYDDATANDETYYRLYHTGDLTRWNHEGRVEFLGRIDSQVKLRGFRIEVGEIETNLAAYPGVRTAIVHLLDEGGKQYLCGYLMCDDELKANFVEHKFRDFLKDKLPSYMIPSRFTTIDVVPRSPAGKLDRKQLKPPPPVAHIEDDGPEKQAPTTEIEHALHRLWSELFPGQRIGTTDDFFQIGGHSLLAGKLASKIRLEGYPDFGIRLVYSNATIVALAAVLGTMVREELPANTGATLAAASPVKLPERDVPGPMRRFLFALFQIAVLTITLVLQWMHLLVFFLVYGSQHEEVALLMKGRGVPFVLFFGVAMQFFFICTNLLTAFVIAPLMKWLVIQQAQPGYHSMWSFYFLRWWTARTFIMLASGTSFLLYGTYLYNIQLRLFGARIGQSCHIFALVFDPDLLYVGNDCFIGDNVTIVTSQVIDSVLVLGTVRIGNCCSVGARSALVGGSQMEDGSVVGPLSLIRENIKVPRGEKWQGSPAAKVGMAPNLAQVHRDSIGRRDPRESSPLLR